MIVKEYFTIKSRDFTRQYSDKGVYIERDGTLYSEAIDPKELEREYTETDIPIEGNTDSEQAQKAAAFDYLTGRGDEDE